MTKIDKKSASNRNRNKQHSKPPEITKKSEKQYLITHIFPRT